MSGDKQTATALAVPEEISDLFLEWRVCNACRDECIRSVFRAKRAIYYGKAAEKAVDRAWRLVKELWSQTDAGTWTYNFDTKVVTRGDDKQPARPATTALSP